MRQRDSLLNTRNLNRPPSQASFIHLHQKITKAASARTCSFHSHLVIHTLSLHNIPQWICFPSFLAFFFPGHQPHNEVTACGSAPVQLHVGLLPLVSAGTVMLLIPQKALCLIITQSFLFYFATLPHSEEEKSFSPIQPSTKTWIMDPNWT